MYRWTRPRIAIPVHGELRHMAEHARLGEAIAAHDPVRAQHLMRDVLGAFPTDVKRTVEAG